MNNQDRRDILESVDTLATGLKNSPQNVPHLLRRVLDLCRAAPSSRDACAVASERLPEVIWHGVGPAGKKRVPL